MLLDHSFLLATKLDFGEVGCVINNEIEARKDCICRTISLSPAHLHRDLSSFVPLSNVVSFGSVIDKANALPFAS